MLIQWLILTAAFWVAALIVPGFEVKRGWATLWVAALFGVLHWLLGWLLFVILGIATLGIGFLLAFITRWVVGAIVLKLVDALSSNIRIRDFKAALLGSLVMSGVGTLAQWLLQRH